MKTYICVGMDSSASNYRGDPHDPSTIVPGVFDLVILLRLISRNKAITYTEYIDRSFKV